MSLISASHPRIKGLHSLDKVAQFLENISILTIVRQPANVSLPTFIRKQKLNVHLINHFHILDENEQKILTAIEIDTSRQLQNFKYILNIFSPDGKLLAAVVQRKKLPTKLHGGEAGDPSPYFRMDQLLPSKLILCCHSCRGYHCKRLYEYNSMNPTAHSHVQWGTGDLLGHIWEGHDHVVALKANLDPVFGVSPICHGSNGDLVARPKFLITTYDTELASRPMGFDVLTLQEIRCGIKSHRLVTRNLFPIKKREDSVQIGVLEVSDQKHPSLLRNEPDGRDIVDVFFPPDMDASDKMLILCAAFTRLFRSSAPIISRCPDDSRKFSYWKVGLYVLINGTLLACMIGVTFMILHL